ncbi:hypothetical protein F4780DRAFT_791657 [Xylariomycetidae sp. FL0641]|nr:hypothetical protein F4780DRAFT_791657 [Xylariomycetidae sp. FL0641]
MDSPDEDDAHLPSGDISDTNSNQNYEPESLEESGTKSSRTSRKRRRRRPVYQSPPLKRLRGPFNPLYLGLLNEEIQDAATGRTLDDEDDDLQPSQLGAVTWSADEKRAFFAAVARLGRDDLAGIAARVGSKSVAETAQYLALLSASDAHRRGDPGKRRRAPRPADLPAAVEVGPACAAALEACADALALRLEAHEDATERRRWPPGLATITEPLATVLDAQQQQQQRQPSSSRQQQQQQQLPFADGLFPLQRWLALARRVFMNAGGGLPDGNWRTVSEAPPAVRATAFADFHGLAASVTRRLVLASLDVAGSRVRARNAADPRAQTRRLVRVQDVRAAAAAVGLQEGTWDFWARAPRRLRLDVHDDGTRAGEDDDVGSEDVEEGDVNSDVEGGPDDEHQESRTEVYEGEEEEEEQMEDTEEDYVDDYEIMSYAEVEAALGLKPAQATPPQPPSSPTPEEDEISSASSQHSSDDDDTVENLVPDDPDIDASLVSADVNEALTYGLPVADTTRARNALRLRVTAEHRAEAAASRADAQASAAAEAALWGVARGEAEEIKPPPTVGDAKSADDDDEDTKTATAKRGLGEAAMPGWREGVRYCAPWERERER